MENDPPQRVDLTGGLEHTASSAEIRPDGSLAVELYDFSQEAESHFGNDVAFLIVVEPVEKERMLVLLQAELSEAQAHRHPDDTLLDLIRSRFASYFEVARWCEEKGIAFHKEFDSWA